MQFNSTGRVTEVNGQMEMLDERIPNFSSECLGPKYCNIF